MTDPSFYNVQPLLPQSEYVAARKTGFDAVFNMPYMGATEYECGGQFKSLKRMRANILASKRQGGLRRVKAFGPETLDISVKLPSGGERKVYLVGLDLENAVPHFQDWIDRGCRMQEAAHFLAALTGEGSSYALERAAETVAWWDFSGDVLWALTPEARDQVVAAVAPPSL